MLSDKWHERFMELARHVAQWSRDPSTKTGSVIVDPETKRVRSMGYNGFPRGVEDTEDRYADRPTKYKMIVHCEANALMNADLSVRGCVLYTTKFPCSECAKLIIQAGIRTVFHAPHGANSSDERWLEDARISRQMLDEAGVGLIAAGDDQRPNCHARDCKLKATYKCICYGCSHPGASYVAHWCDEHAHKDSLEDSSVMLEAL